MQQKRYYSYLRFWKPIGLIFVEGESGLDSLAHEDKTRGVEVVRMNLDWVGDKHTTGRRAKVVNRVVKGEKCSDCFFGALDS